MKPTPAGFNSLTSGSYSFEPSVSTRDREASEIHLRPRRPRKDQRPENPPMKVSTLLIFFVLTAVGFLTGSCASTTAPSSANPFGVRITHTNDVLRVELNGRLFTQYFYTNVPRPFCYPLIGPGGAAMTRNYPMLTNSPGEELDHPHHRSLWFAHGAVNGQDFWTERKTSGRIAHRGFAEILSGTQSGVIRTLNDWVSAEGKTVCTDEEMIKFYAPKDEAIILDYEITLRASNGEVTLGDTKEGTFAIRLAESMRALKPLVKGEKAKPGEGHIVLSTGVRDDGASAAAAKDAKKEAVTWGKRAAWCDYYGPVGTNIVGVAIFDHPSNPRHPTWWHVRDYGLFAANPFGQHDFENLSDKKTGDLKIPADQNVTFRYRVILHEGDEVKGRIAERYAEYVKETSDEKK